MHIFDEDNVFKATWSLYWKIVNIGSPYEDPSWRIPTYVTSHVGSLCTSGGLAIYFFDDEPRWIESPWGEVELTMLSLPAIKHSGPQILWDALDIDDRHSVFVSDGKGMLPKRYSQAALRSVDACVLPPRKPKLCRLQTMEDFRRWDVLCKKHGYPVVPIDSD
jgi:hypothetical protein